MGKDFRRFIDTLTQEKGVEMGAWPEIVVLVGGLVGFIPHLVVCSGWLYVWIAHNLSKPISPGG